MAGRYDDKNNFVARMGPIIDRQIEMYREDPVGYVADVPLKMHCYFVERGPSRKISLAWLMAVSLIATHRRPTAEYIWALMHQEYEPDTDTVWQPMHDPGLTSLTS